jgi:hypothetical protein
MVHSLRDTDEDRPPLFPERLADEMRQEEIGRALERVRQQDAEISR